MSNKNNILIVEDSPIELKLIEKNLEPYKSQFKILTAKNGQEAVKILSQHSITTLITDLYMPQMDGVELLDYMGRSYPKIPCIVVSGYSGPEISDLLDKNNIYQALEKPVNMEKLVNAILDSKVHFDEGSVLDGLSVADALQLINMRKMNCILEATSPTREKGVFYFVEGALYEAECLDLNAEKAAVTMINWENAVLRFKRLPAEGIKKHIGFNLQTLIDQAARRKKEAGDSKGLAEEKTSINLMSDEMFNRAIQRAECSDSKGARQILTALLKHNPRDGQAWLWFSRVAQTMKNISVSLENAHKVAPNNPEIAEENKKLRISLQAGCPNKGDVERCPFCWAPIAEVFDACPYCKAHFSISDNLFKDSCQANSKIIERALHNYTKAVLVEKNANNFYYLGLAFANLGKWDEALDLLNKTIKLGPENKFYKQQLKKLLEQMANLESSACAEDAGLEELKVSNGISADNKKKILVVDDSAMTRKVVRVALTQEGFEVIEAKNGIEAMARFNEITPALVILDIIMPGMDGYEVLSILKKNDTLKKIPVIMLTGRDSLMDKLKGKMSASDEYLTKPFTPQDLMEKINKHLK